MSKLGGVTHVLGLADMLGCDKETVIFGADVHFSCPTSACNTRALLTFGLRYSGHALAGPWRCRHDPAFDRCRRRDDQWR